MRRKRGRSRCAAVIGPATRAELDKRGVVALQAPGDRHDSEALLAALDGKVYPIWMRMDEGILSIWTALVQIQPTGATPAQPRLRLLQNRPNPFNPVTRIDFVIPVAANATLKVYDLSGTHIVTLIDRPLAAGPHSAQWDGRDGRGQRVSSGVYLYELQAGDQSVTRKMTLVK